MAPISSDDGNEPPAWGRYRELCSIFRGAHRCWGASTALRRTTLLALFAAQGVQTGAHDQIDSPDYNCEINTRWHLMVAWSQAESTADLLNAILKD